MNSNHPVKVTRLPQKLLPDLTRVITRFFCPGDEKRIQAIVDRTLKLTDQQVDYLLTDLQQRFGPRHPHLQEVIEENFQLVADKLPNMPKLSTTHSQLIGAYFTMEYALEAAALFNPSMVSSIDQTNLPPGSTRFFMSLRATGEGHISSVVFRRGVIDAENNIEIEPASPYSRQLKIIEDRVFEKQTYLVKLIEMGGYNDLANPVLKQLNEEFTARELNHAITHTRSTLEHPAAFQETADNMLHLARSNYHMQLPPDADPSEIVIFPSSENESHGIEDVRMVRFIDDGSTRYYGTYTAFNGSRIVPQILEIGVDQIIRVHTTSGRYAQNKGMALFPRKIDGLYHMISRLDNENIFLMKSANVRFWNEAELIQCPLYPWELVQIGNCGSPIETDRGWLLLTHGVGPLRQYSIGATLLDPENPAKILGQTEHPLIVPVGDERAGYVPNVVYSCGGMIHNETLIIPYAMSDVCTSFATVNLNELLDSLT